MPFKDDISKLKSGQQINIFDTQGNKKSFTVTIGDALLKGNNDSVWLKRNSKNGIEYLRKLPIKPMTIGPALFSSLEELAHTLESGNYYIG